MNTPYTSPTIDRLKEIFSKKGIITDEEQVKRIITQHGKMETVLDYTNKGGAVLLLLELEDKWGCACVNKSRTQWFIRTLPKEGVSKVEALFVFAGYAKAEAMVCGSRLEVHKETSSEPANN